MRFLIIGGGIGGLTAAIALRKVGIDAQIYERAVELREVGAGIGLAGNALQALDAIGLGEAIRAQSIPGIQGGLRRPDGDILIAIPSDDLAAYAGRVAVMHRAELVSLLAKKVDPACMHLGRACLGVEQDGNGVTARFDNGETARADGLIGADGLRSVVRTQVFGDVRPRYAGYTAWRAVVAFPDSHKLHMGETWGPGSRFGIVPMAGGRVYWFATSNAPEGQKDPAGKKETLRRLFGEWHEPIDALISAASEESILRNDIYDLDPLPHFAAGRVALLGDAAHAMTPNMGQGGCQAIEDAIVLAACLKDSPNIEAALQEYERQRKPRTRQFVLRSRWIGAMAQRENSVLRWARDTMMKIVPGSLAARQMQELLHFEAPEL